MKKHLKTNYTKAIVIVHGASERQIVANILSKLHLNIKVHSRDKGKTSILISCLKNEFERTYFKSKRKFAEKFGIQVEGSEPINFKLFIVMDNDNVDEKSLKEYKNKKMFKDHWLCDYIVPILNNPNLEEVLYDVGLIDNKYKGKDKMRNYSSIFPISCNKLDVDAVEAVEAFSKTLRKTRKTNMYIFTEYCVSLVKYTLVNI